MRWQAGTDGQINGGDEVADWFKHDIDARNDARILKLRQRHGFEGYGIFWAINEMMADTPNCQIDNDVNYLTFALGISLANATAVLQQVIETCLEVGLYHLSEDGFLFSNSLRDRLTSLAEIRAKRAEAGRKGGLSKNQANAKQKLSKCLASREDKSRVDPLPNGNGGETSSLLPSDPKIKFAERISLTQSEYDGLCQMFDPVIVAHYIPVASDWLANGKAKKDHAAFLRNWIRKDQTERKGFFVPKEYKTAFERRLEREAQAFQTVSATIDDLERRRLEKEAAQRQPRLNQPTPIKDLLGAK